MRTETIKIGNMCCSRCIMAVQQVFEKLGVKYKSVELGFAVINKTDSTKNKKLESELIIAGFSIILTKEEHVSEKIKIAIHKLFSDPKLIALKGFNLKVYLEDETQLPYKKISDIFSKYYHKTIEGYFILQRIEKVKAMIEETSLSFSEIAIKLGYNSLSHLSRQFKSITGVSMQNYRLNPKNMRKFIDEI